MRALLTAPHSRRPPRRPASRLALLLFCLLPPTSLARHPHPPHHTSHPPPLPHLRPCPSPAPDGRGPPADSSPCLPADCTDPSLAILCIDASTATGSTWPDLGPNGNHLRLSPGAHPPPRPSPRRPHPLPGVRFSRAFAHRASFSPAVGDQLTVAAWVWVRVASAAQALVSWCAARPRPAGCGAAGARREELLGAQHAAPGPRGFRRAAGAATRRPSRAGWSCSTASGARRPRHLAHSRSFSHPWRLLLLPAPARRAED